MTSSEAPQWKLTVAPYGSQAFQHVKDIRMTVFVQEQKYKEEDEMDEYDAECLHILLLSIPTSGEPIPAGTCRYFPPPKNKIGRVAVMKSARGKGAGGIMMKGLEALLRGEWAADEPEVRRLMDGKEANELVCHAQVPVIPFYRGLGWVEEGDIFDEDGTPHIVMRKSLLSAGQGRSHTKVVETETQA